MNAELIAVGTELLLGNVTNTNARDVSEGLAELGINVFWHTVVGDNPQRLMQCVDIARFRADLIITTGGLGPTCDDLTKQVLAKAFGLELEYHEEIGEALKERYAKGSHTQPFTENTLRQAYLPQGCTVLQNDWGTAPGCTFEKDGVRVIMLPGPPRECVPMFKYRVAPFLLSLTNETILSHQLRMVGIGESLMEEKLQDMMNSLTNPTLAPYAKPGECLVRVTAKAKTQEECEAMMEPVIREVHERIGDYIYGTDVESLEERVLQLLGEKHKTLATAESCTGGLVAKRLTDIPGASEFFKGGVTSYTEEAKTAMLGIKPAFIEKNGVVSAAVASKMAKKVRKLMNADLGIGITGWAGPDGDDVGLVYVALAWEDECVVRRLTGRNNRDLIRTKAANNAFDMVRRYLTGLEI